MFDDNCGHATAPGLAGDLGPNKRQHWLTERGRPVASASVTARPGPRASHTVTLSGSLTRLGVASSPSLAREAVDVAPN